MNVSDARHAEWQCVLIIEFDDGRMYPLVDESAPKCLLPIANRKLLAFQLDMIAKSGVSEVFIVAPSDYQVSLSHFLSDYVIRDNLTIERIFVEKDKFDTCDALRAVYDRLRGDFICISSDIFSKFSLGEVTNFHRIRSSDLTMILVAAPLDEPEKKGGKRKLRVDEEDQEFIAVCEDGRVVMKLPVTDAEEAVELNKALLHRTGKLSLRSDLLDMGIYVLSHWLLEFVVENAHLQSFRADVIPYFIDRQYQPVDYLLETFPSLQHRRRCLTSLEPWLSSMSLAHCAGAQQYELIDSLSRDLLEADSVDMVNFNSICPSSAGSRQLVGVGSSGSMGGLSLNPLERTDSLQSTTGICTGSNAINATGGSSGHGGNGSPQRKRGGQGLVVAEPDLLRVYAFLVDGPESTGCSWVNTSTPSTSTSEGEPLLLQRVTNIQSYVTLNREITLHTHTNSTPWPRLTGYRKKEQSIVGENTVIGAGSSATGANASNVSAVVADKTADKAKGIDREGESTVTLKASTIGHGVVIGARSKINNSILMDNVIVGDNVVLQNSVVCSGAVIESRSNVNECQVGTGHRVVTGKYSKEALCS